MGKRYLLLLVVLIPIAMSLANVHAQASPDCSLSVSLLNQDPFPVIPGDYVELVFQVTGVQSSSCEVVSFQLVEDFPLVFDPDENGIRTINGGTTSGSGYESAWMIPYTVKIHQDAEDGNRTIETLTQSSGSEGFVSRKFDLKVEDVRTDFDIFIENYESNNNNRLTFEILNVGENDAEALTITIPIQEKIQVKGSRHNIVGGLDSFEDTSFNFEAIPKDGEILIEIRYVDEIGEQRLIQKQVSFDSGLYTGRATDIVEVATSTYVLIALIIAIIAYFVWRYFAKKKRKKKLKI